MSREFLDQGDFVRSAAPGDWWGRHHEGARISYICVGDSNKRISTTSVNGRQNNRIAAHTKKVVSEVIKESGEAYVVTTTTECWLPLNYGGWQYNFASILPSEYMGRFEQSIDVVAKTLISPEEKKPGRVVKCEHAALVARLVAEVSK